MLPRILSCTMGDVIEFRLNGRDVCVALVSPNVTLLEWLRANGLTGSKEGCAKGIAAHVQSPLLISIATENRPGARLTVVWSRCR